MAAPALIPDAATYGTEQAQAQNAYDKAKVNLQGQQLGWLQQYGMTAQYDPNSGSYNNYTVDPNNQTGLIQQNRYSEAQDFNADRDDSINRGIGSTGLGAQSTSADQYKHSLQDSQLGTQFTQGMQGFGQQLNDASSAYQQNLYQAEADAIQKALANQQFESYYSGGDTGNNDVDQNDPGSKTKVDNSDALSRYLANLGIVTPTLADTKKSVATNIAKSKSSKKAS